MPLPPFLGIPWMLDRLGALEHDPEQFTEASKRAGDVLNTGDTLHDRLAGMIGIYPQPDETLGHFWQRQTPRSLPPSLAEAQGNDIELPKDAAVKGRPKPSASMRGLEEAMRTQRK